MRESSRDRSEKKEKWYSEAAAHGKDDKLQERAAGAVWVRRLSYEEGVMGHSI